MHGRQLELIVDHIDTIKPNWMVNSAFFFEVSKILNANITLLVWECSLISNRYNKSNRTYEANSVSLKSVDFFSMGMILKCCVNLCR